MRVALVLVAAGLVCSMTADAEARARGGGLFKGGRSSSSAPAPAPAPQAKSGPAVGVGVVVPVGIGRSDRGYARPQQQQHLLPLPPRPADEQNGPKFYSASASEPSMAPGLEKRPWCHDGQVVGRGAGFCEVTLASERKGAPALLALGN